MSGVRSDVSPAGPLSICDRGVGLVLPGVRFDVAPAGGVGALGPLGVAVWPVAGSPEAEGSCLSGVRSEVLPLESLSVCDKGVGVVLPGVRLDVAPAGGVGPLGPLGTSAWPVDGGAVIDFPMVDRSVDCADALVPRVMIELTARAEINVFFMC